MKRQLQQQFQFTTGVIAYPIAFVLAIWLVLWFEVRFGFNFTKYGIYPQKISGLKGIIFSPFIHSGLTHLYHNTIPLFVLSAALFYFYRPIAWRVLGLGILVSGLLTWSIGRPSYHIGVSGLIYVLFGFTIFKGVLAKHYRLIALSLFVVFMYGSMIWYILPIKDGMSWEGHLSGLITGLLFAIIFKKHIAKPKVYYWQQPHYNEEEDPFMKHFDEHGNFIEHLPEDEVISEKHIKINYDYKANKES